MNTVGLRRREYGGANVEVIDIKHPDYQYLEITSTVENQHFIVVHFTSVTDYILDGVTQPEANRPYINSLGHIIIPDIGFHKIYVKLKTQSAEKAFSLRNYGNGVCRGSDVQVFYREPNDTSGLPTKLIILQETPPQLISVTASALCANCDEILVPVQAIDTYKNNNSWKDVKDKIRGVVFNIESN